MPIKLVMRILFATTAYRLDF